MNCVAYENVGVEEFTSEKEAEAQKLSLRAVPASKVRLGAQVARRVAEVVDGQLAQGSMPA